MRRHTDRACDRCRRRKIKCNGESACNQCLAADTSCDYTLPTAKRGPKFRSGTRASRSLGIDACSPSRSPGQISLPDYTGSVTTGLTTSSTSPSIWPSQLNTQKHPAQVAHTNLMADAAGLELSLPEIAERCLHIAVQHIFPISVMFDPASLHRRIDILLPSSEMLFAEPGHTPDLAHHSQAVDRLDTMRSFALLTAICSRVCAQSEGLELRNAPLLAEALLSASRKMLAAHEDQDVVQPDSRSLAIRLQQSATLHALGRSRLSRYILGQAFRLGIDMRLSEEASYASLSEREAQLQRNIYWILYTSDKSTATLTDTSTMLHDDPPLCGTLHTASGVEDISWETMFLNEYEPLLYPEPFERQLGQCIALARRTWVCGSDLLRTINLLFGSLGLKDAAADEATAATAVLHRVSNSYVTFCSLLDYMPPWLHRPDAYTDPDADDAAVMVRKRMFWVQKADLLVTHYCLRLMIISLAFRLGCPSLLGMTADPDMRDLNVTNLAQDLLQAVKDMPHEALHINGEALVEKLRRFGVKLLEISEKAGNEALVTRASRLLTILLDTIASLDSKASDIPMSEGQQRAHLPVGQS